MPFPDPLPIEPIGPFTAAVRPPGSKSLTNRALLLSALAEGRSTLSHVLFAEDTRVMMRALEALGFRLDVFEEQQEVVIQGRGGKIPASHAELLLGNAGTAFRFLTAACCLSAAHPRGENAYRLDGVPRMHQRPIGDLVQLLTRMGGRIHYRGEHVGYPPLQVWGTGLGGGKLSVGQTLSSQYISALLQVGPLCREGLTLHFESPIISRPYVEMTIGLMRRFGAEVQADAELTRIKVKPGGYHAQDEAIEPDASAASYFLAAAAILPGSRCTIPGLGHGSLQGDARFVEVLEKMGARSEVTDHQITLTAPPAGGLHGVEIDLNAMPDMAQTLGVVALFARGATNIRNVGNLRVKETDRLEAMRAELTKLGAEVRVEGDDLRIQPPPDGRLQSADIDTYDDHRMAMSFAVAGLRAPGVRIRNPACVHKTFPNFFEYLNRLRGHKSIAP